MELKISCKIHAIPSDDRTDKRTNERTAEVLYTPIFFLADVYKSYQKLTLEI
jgi:hypothetical protein